MGKKSKKGRRPGKSTIVEEVCRNLAERWVSPKQAAPKSLQDMLAEVSAEYQVVEMKRRVAIAHPGYEVDRIVFDDPFCPE